MGIVDEKYDFWLLGEGFVGLYGYIIVLKLSYFFNEKKKKEIFFEICY